MNKVEQEDNFRVAQKACLDEIGPVMGKWTFEQMMEALKAAIKKFARGTLSQQKNQIRYFSNNYLKISGEAGFRMVRSWIREEAVMSARDIENVLRRLKALEGKSVPLTSLSLEQANQGIRRRVVDHTISMLNSLGGLIADSKITPADTHGSDRGQIRTTLKKTLEALGIEVTFPKENVHVQPVSSGDMESVTKKGNAV